MEAYSYYKDSAQILLDLDFNDGFDNTTLIKIAAAIKNINYQLESTEERLKYIKEVLYKVYPFQEYQVKYSDHFQEFYRVKHQFNEWTEKINGSNFFDLLTVDHVKSAHVIFENNFRSGINNVNLNFHNLMQNIRNSCEIIDEFYDEKAMITKLYVVGNAESTKEDFFSLNENFHYKEFSIVNFYEEEENFQTTTYSLEQFEQKNYYPSVNKNRASLSSVLKTRDRFPAEVEYLKEYYSEHLV